MGLDKCQLDRKCVNIAPVGLRWFLQPHYVAIESRAGCVDVQSREENVEYFENRHGVSCSRE